MQKGYILLFSMLAFFLTNPATAGMPAAPGDVIGEWVTPKMDAVIAIRSCGEGLCGELVEHEYAAHTQTDIYNPREEMRRRPLIGLRILEGLRQVGDRKWGDGVFYDPRTGKTYASKLKLIDENHVKIFGCIGPGLCKGYVWTRAMRKG